MFTFHTKCNIPFIKSLFITNLCYNSIPAKLYQAHTILCIPDRLLLYPFQQPSHPKHRAQPPTSKTTNPHTHSASFPLRSPPFKTSPVHSADASARGGRARCNGHHAHPARSITRRKREAAAAAACALLVFLNATRARKRTREDRMLNGGRLLSGSNGSRESA